MGNDEFHFRHFSIRHSSSAMRVGTDGVLLGAWCATNNARSILDIGTGSGLIAIMLAQRCPAQITGVEIDASAVEQACANAAASPWKERIHIIRCDVKQFRPDEKFDLVVSNPPFFAASKTSEHCSRNIARQTLELSHAELLDTAEALLSPVGELAIILPAQMTEDFIFCAWERGLNLYRRTDVQTTPSKQPKRTLMQFTRKRVPLYDTYLLVLDDGHGKRSAEYSALTSDFYIR